MAILELLAVLALVITALAVMTGAIEPGDAFRRVGTVLVLLVVVPCLLIAIIRSAIAPLITAAVTQAARAAYILAAVAGVAFVAWLVLRLAIRRSLTRHHKESDEE